MSTGSRARSTPAYRRAVAWLKQHPDTPCTWCGAPATTIDHEPPIALGGGDEDLVPACTRCNYSRGATLRHQLARARKRKAQRWSEEGALVADATIDDHRATIEADVSASRSWTRTSKTPPAVMPSLPSEPGPSRDW